MRWRLLDPPDGFAVRDDPGWGWIAYQVDEERRTQIGGPYDFRWQAVMQTREAT